MTKWLFSIFIVSMSLLPYILSFSPSLFFPPALLLFLPFSFYFFFRFSFPFLWLLLWTHEFIVLCLPWSQFPFCKFTGQRLCGSIYCISDTLLHAGLIYLLFRVNLKRTQNNALHIIVAKYIWHFDTAPSALQDFLNFQHSKAHFVSFLSPSYYQLCLQKP